MSRPIPRTNILEGGDPHIDLLLLERDSEQVLLGAHHVQCAVATTPSCIQLVVQARTVGGKALPPPKLHNLI